MAIKRMTPEAAPGPRSDYSLVSVVGADHPTAYLAGQTGRRGDGSIDLEPFAQASDAFRNLERLLFAVDSSPSEIIHMRTYLVGRESLRGFVAARKAMFEEWFNGQNPPTNTLAFVSGLADPDAVIEIEAVAAITPDSFDNHERSK